LEYLLSLVGLKIAEARIVQSYGGSLRVFIVKDEKKFNPEYYRKDYAGIQQWETEHGTNTYEELYAFNSRVHLLCSSLKSLITHINQTQGNKIWGFGASTKGNMILQCLGVNENQIHCILDNSSKKIGKKTIGTNIPILDESTYLNAIPEYLLVLPYYYTTTFVKIIKKYLKPGNQVHLLVPLPHPYFITVTGE
jgi:NDP-4-keto-2,6-dideoxyhexose 3-C-methyltransferase